MAFVRPTARRSCWGISLRGADAPVAEIVPHSPHNGRAAAYLIGMLLLSGHLDNTLSECDLSGKDFEIGRTWRGAE
jgi:hypothetical protein